LEISQGKKGRVLVECCEKTDVLGVKPPKVRERGKKKEKLIPV